MPPRPTAISLAGLIVSLLLVGLVSGTPLRHAIQISPPLVTLAIVLRGHEWGRSAALSIFAFWLFLMVLIWLFLLGLAHLISGHFTPTEIVLTLAIGVFSLVGLLRSGFGRVGWPARLASMAFFLGLQVMALWLSMQPGVARR